MRRGTLVLDTTRQVLGTTRREDELGAFLRSRRARLSPADVGLPPGARRRTPGLRREEVAELAGIGTTWYTWLEQGRDIRASDDVLDNLARALRLTPDERAHLFRVAHRQPPPRARAPREEAPPSARRLLATLGIAPAYITGRRWDLLAWNAAAAAVFGDFGTLPEGERNLVRVIFTDGELRRRFVDWEGTARGVLALFRADRGRYADDPWFAEVIDDLRRVSPEFGRWWPRHDVRERAAGRKEVEHPTVGRLILEPSALHLAGFPDLTLVVYAPLPEQDTARKLQRLVRRGDPCSDAL